MKTNPAYIKFLQDPRLRSQRTIYDGKIFQVHANQIEIEPGVEVQRDLIHHLPAVAILATTAENQVILVKQYRPATAGKLLEIPAGLLDIVNGQLEEPLQAAKRELEEETNYRSEDWQTLGSFWVSPGFTDEVIHLFWAKQAYLVDSELEQDDYENVTTSLSTQEAVSYWLRQQEAVDLKTRYALEIWLKQGEDHETL